MICIKKKVIHLSLQIYNLIILPNIFFCSKTKPTTKIFFGIDTITYYALLR